ncbi:MAG: phosphatase PAP2 family protein [Terriglobales bacterium]
MWQGTRALPAAALRDWRVTVPVLAITGLLITTGDASLSRKIQSPHLEQESKLWSNRGLLDIEPAFTLLAVAHEDRCLFCHATGHFVLTALTTEAYTTAAVQVLKFSAGRERPYTPGDGDGGFNEGGSSFPSGHAAGAFAMAELLYEHDPQAGWTNGLGFSLASGVAAARFTAKEHFPSDLLVGALLGSLLGRCTAHCPPAPDH